MGYLFHEVMAKARHRRNPSVNDISKLGVLYKKIIMGIGGKNGIISRTACN